jgi:formylglycine-generating enzyme required for sulfatase activity
VLCLHAPSGAGKSSLLLAGLVPRLREANVPVCLERRAGEPGLASRLLKDLFDVPDSFELSDDRPDLFGEFATWIAQANRLSGKPPVIILDQADDFLRQPDRRDDALARLGPLMAATARRLPGQRGFPCRWVLCYRHEFHGEVAEWLQDVLLHARRLGRAGLDALLYELTDPDRLHSWAVPVMGTAAPGQNAFDAARKAFLDAIQRPLTLQRPEGGPQYTLRFEDQGAERLAEAFARARVQEPNAPLAPELQVVLGHLLDHASSGADGEVIHVPPDPAALDTRIADALGAHLRRALEDAFPLARDETAARLGRAKALLALRELVDARGLRRGGRSRDELVQAIGSGGDLVVEKLASPGMRLIVPEERGHAWVYVLTHDRLAEAVKAFIDSESARGNLELDARVVELRQFVAQRSDLYLRLQDESALALTREQHDLIESAKAALFLNETQRAWWDASGEWFDFTERLTRNPTSGFQALVELTRKSDVDWKRLQRRLRGVAIDPEVFWSGPWIEGGRDEPAAGERVLEVVERTHRAFLGSTELVRAMSFAAEEVLRRWPAHGARVRALRGRLREGFLGRPGQPAQFRGDAWHLPDDDTGSLGFVKIPKGPFRMGSDPARDPQALADEQPAHDVDLPEFYIGRYLVTVAQFRVFVEATGRRVGPEVLDSVPDHPVVYVTWYDALAYCEWLDRELRTSAETPAWLRTRLEAGAGVVLPSEGEWEKAARGMDGRIYPWNGPIDPSRANYLGGRIGRTTPVGAFPAGASPYGILDMSGNVWEWTRSLWGKQFEKADFTYPYKPGKVRENLAAGRDVYRVVRGGSFFFTEFNVRAALRYWNVPDSRFVDIGFRVVVSPFFSGL